MGVRLSYLSFSRSPTCYSHVNSEFQQVGVRLSYLSFSRTPTSKSQYICSREHPSNQVTIHHAIYRFLLMSFVFNQSTVIRDIFLLFLFIKLHIVNYILYFCELNCIK